MKDLYGNYFNLKDNLQLFRNNNDYLKSTNNIKILFNIYNINCEEIEELWPAIFLKGLIKLNMYKIRHPSYYFKEEFMDTNLIYALTGMQVITLDLNVNLLTLFKNKFIMSKSDFGIFSFCDEIKVLNKKK